MEQQERIVEKAHELFLRYGIRSISMDEIATHLGISKKTIYQFFTDKDALVEAVVDREIAKNEHECNIYHAKSKNPVHEVLLALEMVEDLLRMMNPIMIYDLQKYHVAAFKKFNEHKNTFLYKMIKENVENGIAMELYRPDINVSIITRYRLATIFLIFNPDLLPLGKNRLHDVMREMTMNFLYGLATAKGVKMIAKYNLQRQKND